MAQYTNVGGVARRVAKRYENIGGVARNIVTAFCNVNGAARQFFNTVPPLLSLFNYGDKCETVTGGWSHKGAKNGSNTGYASDPNVTFYDTHMTMKQGGGHRAGYVYAVNKIDLTHYSELCAEVSVEGESGAPGDSGGCRMVVFSSTDGTDLSTYMIKQVGLGAQFSGKATLDVSDIKGSYYVGLWMVSALEYDWTMTINSVYLNV